ncbi:S-methylmethionine-dependent homocysteine/selenocysteine methylase [Bradyrhizobium sp. AZCC 1719]|uniref:homocysteine S-methyltransferase family protein n=1 Tax=Bradyrhizobium sp. AZCC 1719 TaxID=3117028 RepID=UPI002FF1D911
MSTFASAKYRHRLPQLDGRRFLTDGGLETTLIFHEGWDLPMFQAFTLLESERGRAALRAYFDRYVPLAVNHGVGFVLESPTWRANPEWGAKIGYGRDALARLNHAAIHLMREVREAYENERTPIVISGCIGPRGDGYDPGKVMSVNEAEAYHSWQVSVLRDAGADMVSAFTMNNFNEALGVTRAAQAAQIPCVISFTVETDGRLPTGDSLADVVEALDAATGRASAYYMINCAHPTHFEGALDPDAPWMKRLRGLRANSSRRTHAELDNATELDAGNPVELGVQYADLSRRFPHINVLGGCCGTDHRHIECIGLACSVPA